MHRPIGVQNRKSMTSLKLVGDTPLQQLTLTSLTLISFCENTAPFATGNKRRSTRHMFKDVIDFV